MPCCGRWSVSTRRAMHLPVLLSPTAVRTRSSFKKLAYHDIRRDFGLGAQMTVRAIAKVVEAYKRDKDIQPTFRPHGAIVYDQRILSWKGADRVSILTNAGRQIMPWVCGARISRRCLSGRERTSRPDLSRQHVLPARDDRRLATCRKAIPPNISALISAAATLLPTSDGETFCGAHNASLRNRHARLRHVNFRRKEPSRPSGVCCGAASSRKRGSRPT